MKKIGLVVLGVAIVAGLSTALIAGSGLPTSNVLYDTSANGGTLVMRESDGSITHLASDIVTADIASEAVTTDKMYLDQPSSRIPCFTTAKKLGNCTSLTTAGVCNNCN